MTFIICIFSIHYMCQINLGFIVAYQAELQYVRGMAADDEPDDICDFVDENDDYYGYRVCINMVAAGLINILLCMVLLIIDLFNPCLNSGVSLCNT